MRVEISYSFVAGTFWGSVWMPTIFLYRFFPKNELVRYVAMQVGVSLLTFITAFVINNGL